VRIAIEWNYGVTSGLFKYLCNHRKLKVLASHSVANIYTLATLLRNCHVILYGCQSSNYFELTMHANFLNAYLTQTTL